MPSARIRREAASATALVAVAGAALALAGGATAGEPIPVEWSGATFSTRAELAGWLAARGEDYTRWARLHPQAAAQLEGRAPVVTQAPVQRTDAQFRPFAEVAPAQRARAGGPAVWIALAALVVVLAALAIAPLPRRGLLVPLRGRRVELGAAAVAVAIGVLVGRGLG